MATDTTYLDETAPAGATPSPGSRRALDRRWLLLGGPLGALIAGLSSEFVDFRALRVPLLITVGFCVLAAAYALLGYGHGARAFAARALTGCAVWGAGGVLYVVLHSARGESFNADRFGAQWSQAIALIGVHALLLGLPTGIVAALLVHIRWRRLRAQRDDAPRSKVAA